MADLNKSLNYFNQNDLKSIKRIIEEKLQHSNCQKDNVSFHYHNDKDERNIEYFKENDDPLYIPIQYEIKSFKTVSGIKYVIFPTGTDNALAQGGDSLVTQSLGYFMGEPLTFYDLKDNEKKSVFKVIRNPKDPEKLDKFKEEIVVTPQFMQAELIPDGTMIKMRKLEGDDLDQLIKNGATSDLTPQQKFKLAVTILEAVQLYIVKQGFIHFDIKPANIIVKLPTDSISNNDIDTWQPKVTILDFDLAIQGTTLFENDGRGTFGYMAPEIYDSKLVTSKVDVYSTAAVLLNLLAFSSPDTYRSYMPNQEPHISEESSAMDIIRNSLYIHFNSNNDLDDQEKIDIKCFRLNRINARKLSNTLLVLKHHFIGTELEPFVDVLVSMTTCQPENRITIADAIFRLKKASILEKASILVIKNLFNVTTTKSPLIVDALYANTGQLKKFTELTDIAKLEKILDIIEVTSNKLQTDWSSTLEKRRRLNKHLETYKSAVFNASLNYLWNLQENPNEKTKKDLERQLKHDLQIAYKPLENVLNIERVPDKAIIRDLTQFIFKILVLPWIINKSLLYLSSNRYGLYNGTQSEKTFRTEVYDSLEKDLKQSSSFGK